METTCTPQERQAADTRRSPVDAPIQRNEGEE